MNYENPDHILQQQEQYQAAVRNATKLLHSAVLDAQLAVTKSFQIKSSIQDAATTQESLINDSLKNDSTAIIDIVDSAFQKAKVILNDASMSLETSQILDSSAQAVPEQQIPTLPGFPATKITTETAENDTETPEDLLSQNMKWMDSSMLQLFESMQNQPETK
ncbi:hypothetical protein [Gimesia aquarii]|uniref:Uncharacterized protein n=1 Tax=Gimesia aquarii TaxID=2527964 RepID=A0A517VV16_9PLAN|nr:hypothetical protein [Gimesia aquarii]QDT96852.1 hypothetical protein V144x_23100 [Gimesia aquarii]